MMMMTAEIKTITEREREKGIRRRPFSHAIKCLSLFSLLLALSLSSVVADVVVVDVGPCSVVVLV